MVCLVLSSLEHSATRQITQSRDDGIDANCEYNCIDGPPNCPEVMKNAILRQKGKQGIYNK